MTTSIEGLGSAPSDVAGLDWATIKAQLDEQSHARVRALLEPSACRTLCGYYDSPNVAFRSTINMARHGYGRGEYRYFDYPLPAAVATLRAAFYPHLAAIANLWRTCLGNPGCWPADLDALTACCHAAGQSRPTPLLLRYRAGDFNCLHQDIYGEIQFPLQVVILLSTPGKAFDGGELVLTEQRPRRQSRPIVVPLELGDAVIMPVSTRPEPGRTGYRRVTVRHGVSEIHRGQRTTLGLIFHDAA